LTVVICLSLAAATLAKNCTKTQNCAGCYEGVCTSCRTGFYRSGTSCIAATAVANCEQYTADNTCNRCVWPYVLNKQGACSSKCSNITSLLAERASNTCVVGQANPTNNGNNLNLSNAGSTTCTNNEVFCHTCRFGMPDNRTAAELVTGFATITGNQPQDGCIKVTPDHHVHNCEYMDFALECTQCIKGWVLSWDKKACHKESSSVKNCLQLLDLYGEECKICHDGFWAKSIDKCVEV